jgi:signal peptidase I
MRRNGAALALALAATACGPATRDYSVPSNSMAPTVAAGDRVQGRMERPEVFHRGDILLVEAGRGETWIARVVGLPGDRVELIDGIVHINGRAVGQRLVRTEPAAPQQRHLGLERRRMIERLPGETGSHELYDAGISPGDEFAVQTVRPGHLFLLGDNRDDSLDSRFAADPSMGGGLGQVSFERVRGIVQTIYRPQ